MKITPEMFGLTKEEVAQFEKQDERLAKLREKLVEQETQEFLENFIAETDRMVRNSGRVYKCAVCGQRRCGKVKEICEVCADRG